MQPPPLLAHVLVVLVSARIITFEINVPEGSMMLNFSTLKNNIIMQLISKTSHL